MSRIVVRAVSVFTIFSLGLVFFKKLIDSDVINYLYHSQEEEFGYKYKPHQMYSVFNASSKESDIIIKDFQSKDNVSERVKYIYYVTANPKDVGKRAVLQNEGFFRQRCGLPCLMTNDKDFLGSGNIDQFDALIFKIRFFRTDQKARLVVPEKRSPHQRYILSTHESPRQDLIPRFVNLNYLSKNFYNWTLNFRKDSDIIESYGPFLAKVDEPPPFQTYKSVRLPTGIPKDTNIKSKMVFWTVSHCKTINLREVYVEKLRQYMDVDVFGSCSGVECSRQATTSCFKNEGLQYWFYLSFENSNCHDYITEKLWRILDLPIVPIVMGGGNYTRDAPPHSVIDVNDFQSVKELAEYLFWLTENTAEYLKYFEWKKSYVLYYQEPLCVVCQKLHDPHEPIKVYPDMEKWFYFDQNGHHLCTNGSERAYFQSMFD